MLSKPTRKLPHFFHVNDFGLEFQLRMGHELADTFFPQKIDNRLQTSFVKVQTVDIPTGLSWVAARVPTRPGWVF